MTTTSSSVYFAISDLTNEILSTQDEIDFHESQLKPFSFPLKKNQEIDKFL